MKAIMISGKPKWSAKIANGDKSTEIRTSKSLYKAIQKLIDEYGYADIYWYCTKDNHQLVKPKDYDGYLLFTKGDVDYSHEHALNGKVIFKFRCYKVEDLHIKYGLGWETETIKGTQEIEKATCVDRYNLYDYCKGKAYAVHITKLEIFDKPKELSEFKSYKKNIVNTKINGMVFETELDNSLIKAPQNYCYVEVEDEE